MGFTARMSKEDEERFRQMTGRPSLLSERKTKPDGILARLLLEGRRKPQREIERTEFRKLIVKKKEKIKEW